MNVNGSVNSIVLYFCLVAMAAEPQAKDSTGCGAAQTALPLQAAAGAPAGFKGRRLKTEVRGQKSEDGSRKSEERGIYSASSPGRAWGRSMFSRCQTFGR